MAEKISFLQEVLNIVENNESTTNRIAKAICDKAKPIIINAARSGKPSVNIDLTEFSESIKSSNTEALTKSLKNTELAGFTFDFYNDDNHTLDLVVWIPSFKKE